MAQLITIEEIHKADEIMQVLIDYKFIKNEPSNQFSDIFEKIVKIITKKVI